MMLATTASIFDPSGPLSPAVISYIFLHKLWQDKLKWDELLTSQLQQEWNQPFQTIPNSYNQDNQEGYLLQSYPHSTTWILQQQ